MVSVWFVFKWLRARLRSSYISNQVHSPRLDRSSDHLFSNTTISTSTANANTKERKVEELDELLPQLGSALSHWQ